MKRYRYVAVNPKTDQIVRKELTAKNQQEVKSIISSQNMDIVLIEELKEKGIKQVKFGRSVSRPEKINLTNELSIMFKAGISIVDSIDIIKEGMKNQYLVEILEGIKYSVQSGNSLAGSLEGYKEVFGPVFIAMVEAGENSGKLSETLTDLSAEIKRDHRLYKDVTGAMIYPAVIVSTLILISLAMFVFVVPKIAQVYESLAVKLPIPTKIFLVVGTFLSQKWWLAIPIIVFLAIFFWWGIKSKQGKRVLSVFQRKLPVLKDIFSLFNYVRFSRVLGILLSSGLQINNAVLIAAKGFSDPKLTEAGQRIAHKLEEGVSLAEAMRKEDCFPPNMIKMIEVGEKSGRLDALLKDLADYYSEELKDRLGRFTSLIEPVLVVLIGVAIGVMVVSLIGPIYGIISQLSQ